MSISGVFQLQVDNRFIDYFKKDTEIYQGMSVIDTQLGGTTPLSIVIDAEKDFFVYLKEVEKDRLETDFSDDPFKEVEELLEGVEYLTEPQRTGPRIIGIMKKK